MSHCLPSVVAGRPLAGNIIGIVWDKDSLDPCSLNYNAIWTSLCSCDYITGSIGCIGGTSGIYGTVVAGVSGGVVGCTGVTSVVYGSSVTGVVSSVVCGTGVTSIVDSASSVGITGSIVGGTSIASVVDGVSGGTSGIGISGSVVSGVE